MNKTKESGLIRPRYGENALNHAYKQQALPYFEPMTPGKDPEARTDIID